MSKITTIYVELEEEITSVVERIRKIPVEEIILVIPFRAHISSGLINLKILKNETEKLTKKIIVVSKDPLCRSLAQKVGLLAQKKIMQDSFEKLDKFNRDKKKIDKALGGPSTVKSKASFVKQNKQLELDQKGRAKPQPPPQVDPQTQNSFSFKTKKSVGKSKANPVKKSLNHPPLMEGGKSRSIDGLTKAPTPVKNKVGKPFSPIYDSSNSIKKTAKQIKKKGSSIKQESQQKSQDRVLAGKEELTSKKKNQPKENLEKIKLLPDNFFWIAGGVLLVLLIIIVLLLSFVFSKARVKIILEQNKTSFSDSILVSTQKDEIGDNVGILAQKMEDEIIAKDRFQANGEAEEIDSDNKAVGTVIIFNEFSTSPEVLIRGTRFATPDGLMYKLTQEVFIKGYTEKNGEILPGKASAMVVAEKKGDQYLIDTREKLRVPGLKQDEQRYEKIYAKFQDPVKKPGDISAKIVNESDIEKAKEQLKEKLEKKIKNKDFDFNPELEIIQKTVEAESLEYEIDVQPGIRTESFEALARSNISGLAYNKDDLKQAIVKKSALKFGENQDIVLNKQINIVDSEFLEDENSIELKIECDLLITRKIQKEKIIQSLKGLDEKKAYKKLKSLNDISQVKIEFWPFWINNIPADKERIQITTVP